MRSAAFLLALLPAVPALSQGPAAPAPETAAAAMVNAFYAWYVPVARRNHKLPAEIVALREKGACFGARLAKALEADWAARQKVSDDIVGLDFDPFLNAQDLARRYQVGGVERRGDTFRIGVHRVPLQKKPDLVAEVAQEQGRWVFVNFHYGDGPDLLQLLQQLAKERAGSGR